MLAKRIKSYGANFALYKLNSTSGIRIMDASGRDINPSNFNGVVGVNEITFCGKAKGKTGSHALDADNTAEIEILSVKLINGKYNACRWELTNQKETDNLYYQRKNFCI